MSSNVSNNTNNTLFEVINNKIFNSYNICSHCNKEFSTNSLLISHIKTNHPYKNYPFIEDAVKTIQEFRDTEREILSIQKKLSLKVLPCLLCGELSSQSNIRIQVILGYTCQKCNLHFSTNLYRDYYDQYLRIRAYNEFHQQWDINQDYIGWTIDHNRLKMLLPKYKNLLKSEETELKK